VRAETRETRDRLRRTVLVVVACSAVPLVASLILVAAKRAADRRHQRRQSLTQRHVTTTTANSKDLPGHVVHGAGVNAMQPLPLGYDHQQVNLRRFTLYRSGYFGSKTLGMQGCICHTGGRSEF